MTTPARRPSPAVYRRRRLMALLILFLAIAAIVAVVLAIWQPWREAQPAAPAPVVTSSSAVAPPATPATPATPAEAATAAPDPSGTDPAIAACTGADITVLAGTDKDAYGAGELPQLSITLSNTSQNPCLINVGTATQEFEITSGADVWWRSSDCQSEPSDQVVQLAGGQTVSSVTPLVWDRTRSAVDTCDAARPQAGPGTYHLQVSIAGITAADTKRFELR